MRIAQWPSAKTCSQLRGSAGFAPASLSVTSHGRANVIIAKEHREKSSTGNIDCMDKGEEMSMVQVTTGTGEHLIRSPDNRFGSGTDAFQGILHLRVVLREFLRGDFRWNLDRRRPANVHA